MHSISSVARGRPARGVPLGGALVALAVLVGACTGQTAVGEQGPPIPTRGPQASAPATVQQSSAPAARPTPRATLPHVPPLQPPAYASRVAVGDLGIDLPVVSGDLQPPPNYPFCDVAAWVTLFGQPYEDGITYISAHAQKGMFLPLLAASERNGGQQLMGMKVQVFVNDGRRFDYSVERVNRHATDYSVVDQIPLDVQTLIVQTSEGTYGTLEKLQVIAAFESETAVDRALANPEPHPRDCEPSGS